MRSAIQQIVVEHKRRYGDRRITAEIRRHGMLVKHERVARMMREDNLLAVQPRKFWSPPIPIMGWRSIFTWHAGRSRPAFISCE